MSKVPVDTMDLHSIGTAVTLAATVEAKIVAISIRGNNYVQYECAWWSGSSLTKDWFCAAEFISVGEKDAVTKIGFIRGKAISFVADNKKVNDV